MKTVALWMGILCLTSCSATFVSIDKLPKYGTAVPGTIHVLASHGFKRQGHYYLPKGATLGLLIDIAGWKPVSAEKFAIPLWGDMWLFREESRFLLVQHNWGQDYKTDYYVSWLDKNGMPYEHRQRLLLDGDRVMRSGFLY